MPPTLVKIDADATEWSGRTALSGSLEDLRAALFSAAEDERTAPGAALVLTWLDALEAYPPEPAAPIANSANTPLTTVAWEPTAPDEPHYTPPLPFDFVIPAEAGVSPLDALAPWWREIAPAPSRQVAEDTHTGKGLIAGTWSTEGGMWTIHPGCRFSESSSLSLSDGRLEARSLLKATTAEISGPGLIGSLVPGYGELKALASKFSEKTERVEVGCRVPLSSISAIGYESSWHLRAPLLNRRLKRLVRERGYGEHSRAEVTVEFSDGWRPYRVGLSYELLRPEHEHAPLDLFKALLRVVAADPDTPVHEKRAESAGVLGIYTRTARMALTHHRPISVPLSG